MRKITGQGRIKRIGIGVDVVTAARERIRQIYSHGCKVYVNSSGGKDSIVLMNLIYEAILSGDADPKRTEVCFIDEEVIYPEVVRICEQWRKKFMLVGVPYRWYTIEHRNNNCFNSLEANESFIPWDRYEADKWGHPKPPYAISESPYLVPRVESYQEFLSRAQKDGIRVIGVRIYESVQRLLYMADIMKSGGITNDNTMYPIFDWRTSDVWKYIKDNNLDFPDVYIHLYEGGLSKTNLRVCNLFAIDTCRVMSVLFEVYPDLWEIVLRREPNAELVRLYWDSDMFARKTQKQKSLGNVADDGVDYKEKLFEMFRNMDYYFPSKHQRMVASRYRKTCIELGIALNDDDYKDLYNHLLAGDTKERYYRAFRMRIITRIRTWGNGEGFAEADTEREDS